MEPTEIDFRMIMKNNEYGIVVVQWLWEDQWQEGDTVIKCLLSAEEINNTGVIVPVCKDYE